MGMGASTEILLRASELGLRVKEVPITISYNNGPLKHNPVSQGLDVILSTVKYLSIRRPLLFYGVPGMFFLAIAAFFWFWTLDIFVQTRSIVTNITLIAVVSTLAGLMFMSTAVLLWVIVSVVREKL